MSTHAHHRPLLTVDETAEWLGVSTRTVRRLIDRRELPSVRVGGSIRVDPRLIDVWLSDRVETR